MAQNNQHFSIEDAKRIAGTEACQKLLSLLKSQDPQRLQAAMKQATSGDFEQLKQTLGAFVASPEAQSLLKQMENRSHE